MVAAVKVKLDDVALLGIDAVRVKRVVLDLDTDGLGPGDGSQGGGGKDRFDGEHCNGCGCYRRFDDNRKDRRRQESRPDYGLKMVQRLQFLFVYVERIEHRRQTGRKLVLILT